jgi:hypothetical protein
METGCFNSFLSKYLSNNCFRIKINKIPINIGSVGKSTLKLNPGINSRNGTENGTKKTENSKTLSKAKNIAKKTISAKGSKLNNRFSSLIIIQELKIIKKNAIE